MITAWVVDTKTVVNGKVALLKTFTGSQAEAHAIDFIATLPDYMSGRYGLDVGRS